MVRVSRLHGRTPTSLCLMLVTMIKLELSAWAAMPCIDRCWVMLAVLDQGHMRHTWRTAQQVVPRSTKSIAARVFTLSATQGNVFFYKRTFLAQAFGTGVSFAWNFHQHAVCSSEACRPVSNRSGMTWLRVPSLGTDAQAAYPSRPPGHSTSHNSEHTPLSKNLPSGFDSLTSNTSSNSVELSMLRSRAL